MSMHSYTRVWLHLVWGTLKREHLLSTEDARKKLSTYLYDYSNKHGIFMNVNYVNSDHIHALIDLPTNLSLENMMQHYKGSSSHWISQSNILPGKFAWGRGYAIYYVYHSKRKKVRDYILNQIEKKKKKTFNEEYDSFIEKHGLVVHKPD